MALTAQPPAGPSWGRWPQPYGSNNYVMADGLIPYDNRPVSQAPPPRPDMASQQYMMGSSYTVAPMTSITSPHFPPPNQYGFPYSSPPAPTPYRQQPSYHPERPSLTILPPEDDRDRPMPYQSTTRDQRSAYEEHSQSPSLRSEPSPSTKPGPKVAKTVSSVISINPENEVSFDTEVDVLMKAIQAKRETESIVYQAETKIKQEHGQMTPEAETAPAPSDISSIPDAPASQPNPTRLKSKQGRKKYTCDVPECGREFGQKTHLDIHKRAHTGDKPYMCKLPGCGQKFSQLGNLRTHERRHAGIKPFKCSTCEKRFTQRGNVRAHEMTHKGLKPYHCKLEGCGKDFSQLGNLKSHMNKFHADALKELTLKFASISDGTSVTEADKELWEYFATMYKNLNKGIRGRGKHRKVNIVGPMTPMSPVSPGGAVPLHLPGRPSPPLHHPHHQHQHAHTHQPQQHLNHPHQPQYHGPAHPNGLSPYNMNRPVAHGHEMMVPHEGHSQYMFEVKEEHDVVTPSSANTLYEERPY